MPVLKIKKNGIWETVGYEGSGDNIPEYTESDYGKVLSATADGLIWTEQTGGSGIITQPDEPTNAEDGTLWIDTDEEEDSSKIFIVEVDPTTMTASHSASEIIAAKDAGKTPILNTGGAFTNMSAITSVPSVKFAVVQWLDSLGLLNAVCTVYDDKTIEMSTKSILPISTESDYGKVLSVTTDGTVAWTAQSESVPIPDTAEVGQTMAVKTIDENGKPTEWEAVNMSSEEIGDLNDLTTTDKTSLVAAINELAASAGAGSGEPEIFLVTVDSAMTASHSASEIYAAKESGKIVFLTFNNLSYYVVNVVTETSAMALATTITGTSGFAAIGFVIDESKTVTTQEVQTEAVPTPTESDYGKVLSATTNGISWIENSTPTLTEHLASEQMVLSSLQYGDELPEAGTVGRLFFKKVTK